VIELPLPASEALMLMEKHDILAGYDLGSSFPALNNCLLVNVTETKTEEELELYVNTLIKVLESREC
jgi:glycine dehydrogenase subunit 1